MFPEVDLSLGNGTVFCEGSLLSAFIVLTAASCLTNLKVDSIKVKLSDGDGEEVWGKFVLIHEGFRMGRFENNVALLILQSSISNGGQFVKFPQSRAVVPELTTVNGWGLLGYGHSHSIVKKRRRGQRSKRGWGWGWDHEEGDTEEKAIKTPALEEIRCLGKVGDGACEGLTGGPIFCQENGSGSLVQCGINGADFSSDKGNKGYPTLFTEIIYFLDWIEDKVFCICQNKINCNPAEKLPKCYYSGTRRRDFPTVKIAFEIAYIYGAPDGVVTSKILVINNTFPGPVIRAMPGDIIEIEVVNQIQDGQGVTIHYHGIPQKGYPFEDGPSGITQCPIKKGERHTYRFPVLHPGTFWYHSHVGLQFTEGLFGVLIVQEPEKTIDYHGEFTIMINEWYHRSAKENQAWYLSRSSSGFPPYPDSALMNGHGRYDCSLALEKNRTCLQSLQLRPVFNLHKDKAYVIRLVNTGGWATYNITIDNHLLDVIEMDGIFLKKPAKTRGLYLGAGQRYSFLLSPISRIPDNSEFLIRAQVRTDHLFTNEKEGENLNPFPDYLLSEVTGVIKYVDSYKAEKFERSFKVSQSKTLVREIMPSFEQFDYTQRVPRPRHDKFEKDGKDKSIVKHGVKAPAYFDKEFIVDLTFTKGRDGILKPSINDIPFKYSLDKPMLNVVMDNEQILRETQIFEIEYGDVVDVIIYNVPEHGHPIHLHGHNFWVLGTGDLDEPFDRKRETGSFKFNRMPRDTVAVKPYSWTLIRFVADNPGAWAFHCHFVWHNVGGMKIVFIEAQDFARRLYRGRYEKMKELCGRFKSHNKNSTSLTKAVEVQECEKTEGTRPTITIDTSETKDLQEFAKTVKKTLENLYFLISSYLDCKGASSPPSIFIKVSNAHTGAPVISKANSSFTISAEEVLKRKDVGVFVYLSVFLIEGYVTEPLPPGWWGLGLARYFYRYWYEHGATIKKPLESDNYKTGGDSAAFFLNYLRWKIPANPTTGRDFIQDAHLKAKKGLFNEVETIVKNKGKGWDQLWSDMLKDEESN